MQVTPPPRCVRAPSKDMTSDTMRIVLGLACSHTKHNDNSAPPLGRFAHAWGQTRAHPPAACLAWEGEGEREGGRCLEFLEGDTVRVLVLRELEHDRRHDLRDHGYEEPPLCRAVTAFPASLWTFISSVARVLAIYLIPWQVY